jgi:hypothetical protein
MAEVERFWCARGKQFGLDRDGFLTDPERPIVDRFSSNPEAIPTSALRSARSAVLLGEMGAGKSTVLQRPELLLPLGIKVLAIDLAQYGSEVRLIEEVVQHPSIEQWLAGSTELALVLDGFDEAQERIPQLGKVLAAAINTWPTERLVLRIASRTVDWSRILERSIGDSFDDPTVVVALLPLRRDDARAIAAELCDDPDAFLSAVDGSGASAFASRPQTLRMLARSFQSSGTLPDRAADVYEQGLRWLAQEANEGRVESRLVGSLSIDERIAVARRVAAGLTFGRAAAVRTDRLVHIGSEDLEIATIAYGVEPASGRSISVTDSAVREVLSSAMFATVGSGRLGFAHASFGDYLTAAWIHTNGLDDDRVQSLLIGPDGRVRPQLRGTAAWLVAIAPDRFGWLTVSDAECFLGPVDIPTADLRASVIEGLFAVADRRNWSWSESLEGLDHPAIAQQIQQRMSNGSEDQRRLAIKLARDCRTVEVLPYLTRVALDPTLDDGLRSRAGHAAIAIGSSETSTGLAALAVDESIRGDDEMDELLAVGLTASWPHRLSTAEVFSLLHAPKRNDLFGAYRRFIDDFAIGLRPEDAGPAISWLEAHVDEIDSGGFERLADKIVELAGKGDIDAGMRASLCRIAVARAENYEGIIFGRGLNRPDHEVVDVDSRRRIASAIVDGAVNDTVILYVSDRPARGSGLLTGNDLEWIFAEAATATGQRLAALVRLFGLVFDMYRRDHAEFFLELDWQHPIRMARRDLVQVEWESATAVEMKRMYALLNPSQQRQPGEITDEDGRIDEVLAKIDGGEAEAFIDLGRTLAATETAFDLTTTATWRIAGPEQRDRIVTAAQTYLTTRACDPDAWLDDPSILHFAAYAGYRAMTLLLRVRPAALEQLSAADWAEWAPIIATKMCTVDGPSWEDKLELLRRANVNVHDVLVAALTRYISAAAATDQHLYWANEVDFLFDDEIQAFIVRFVEAGPSPLTGGLLEVLCRKEPEVAVPILRSMFADQEPEQRAQRVAAGILLFDHDLVESWPVLRSAFDGDNQLALDVVGNTDTVRYRDGDTLLPEDTLAEIYLWLRQRFDPSGDPQHAGVHVVDAREQVGRWRDRLLIELRDRGTASAIDALAALSNALPSMPSLQRIRATAMTVFSQKSWTGRSIRDLVALAQDTTRALVNTELDLQVVIRKALTIVQRELTGANPQSHLLWDTHSKRPKTEDEISDHLRNRLAELTGGNRLVVNREVQVRRNQPSGVPERADIQIDAATGVAGPFATISYPIEAKGAWNDELMTAMRSQLVEKYMTDLHVSHGCYVVLWPDVEDWTEKDARRRAVARLDRDEVVEQLAIQATQLRNEGYFVDVVHLGEYKRPSPNWRQRIASGPLRFLSPSS